MKAVHSSAWMRRVSRGLAFAAFVVFPFVVASCDTLLEVEQPAAVTEEFVEDPSNATLLVTSAIAAFECAFAEYIVAGGLIGNELWDGQLAARQWPYDRRSFDGSTGDGYAVWTCAFRDPGVYQTLSTARFMADFAIDVLEGASEDAEISNRAQLIATAHAYGGYSRLLLGEGMCSAAIDGGPEVTSQQIFALAEEEFTAALSGSPPSDIADMARVGRARARINQGKTAEALADAQQVPVGFVKNATYSGASYRSSNRVWTYNNRDELSSVEDEFHDLTWRGVPDPRVPVVDQGKTTAGDDLTPFWTQEKYDTASTSIPIARYEEAQLIIAEVEGGQTAIDIINALHDAAGIPPYDPTADGQSIIDHLIQERQREFFLESHHLYDKIRFGVPFVPAQGTPFQETGSKGGFYGNTACLPLPEVERDNNPNIP